MKPTVLYVWLLWAGIETVGGPMWTETPTTYVSRAECLQGAELHAQLWENRMKERGREAFRTGTDVVTRLESGSILMARFVCLPDTTDPRQRQ